MMKKILITGQNSYIGSSLINWFKKHEPQFECTEISLRGEEWKFFNFSDFDCVIHVAGIAHQKESNENRNDYFNVNHKLAVEVANKAYISGIKKFVFMSSMSIFGRENGRIYSDTIPEPVTFYGQSKFLAEEDISKIPFESLCIIRPPMVYGPNCKGNYQTLSKLSKILPIFPNFINIRSMIFIDNLSEFIRIVLKSNISGVFHPQNARYVETASLVSLVREANRKKTILTKIYNPLIKRINLPVLNKVFGSLTYDHSISLLDLNYNVVSFEKSIIISEEVNENYN